MADGGEFTSKERDAETGLDFFGVRYMSSAQGRFTSPDPFLNSGRPSEPQSWNRYAYVLNNPLRNIDPNGLWDFGSCDFGSAECRAYQQRIRSAYDDFVKKAQSFNEGSDQRKELDRVISNLGTEGDKNGVTFAFASLAGEGVVAAFDQSNKTITYDLPKLDNIFLSNPRIMTAGYNRNTEVTGNIAHEGTHLADSMQGLFSLSLPKVSPINMPAIEASEFRAYRNESFVHQAGGTRALTGVWNPSWSTADAETLRSRGVSQAAQRSVDQVKEQVKAAGR